MVPTRGTLIGAGHFGTVYAGQDPLHGNVALKVFSQISGEDPLSWQARKDALLQEGKRLSEATHANVVRVFSIHESPKGDEITLVLEHCAGGCLETAYLAGPMFVQDVRRHATSVALGLQALHARGMIHRDIKPANILLDAHGHARVGDFGLVTNDVVLGYASIRGYSDHVAVEVHRGDGTSVKSDVWALGMTLYRLLHGETWYRAMLPPKRTVPMGGFAQKLPWLPHVPDGWRKFIRKTMHDDTTHRYQTMQNVLDALAGLPVVPDWDASVTNDAVEWRLERGERRYEVRWDRITNEWEATSYPRATHGLKRHLGASRDLAELEDWFGKLT